MTNEDEKRSVRFDRDLQIEAYRFQGVEQKFPNHFHPYYVIGLIEQGERRLFCGQMEWIVGPGDLLLFQPLASHACEAVDDQSLDYRCLNIKPEVMDRTARALDIPAAGGGLIAFSQPVALRAPPEITGALRELHQGIMEGAGDRLLREEQYLLLMERILGLYGGTAEAEEKGQDGVAWVCEYLEQNYGQRIGLEDLEGLAGMGRYRLIREFTRQRGITPYRYLEAARISAAKGLLEGGMEPIDAAAETGFSDQSHFTNAFKARIGLTPKQYQRIFEENVPGLDMGR